MNTDSSIPLDKSTKILDIPWNVNDAEMTAQYELDQEMGIEKKDV